MHSYKNPEHHLTKRIRRRTQDTLIPRKATSNPKAARSKQNKFSKPKPKITYFLSFK
jgi:hypothetical protein